MKKRVILFFVIIMLCLTGCQHNNKITNIHAEWPVYNSTEEIIESSSNIYSGEVTNISFEIIDMKTGKVDRSIKSDSNSRMLYTVYTVSVTTSFKGDNQGIIQICRTGGLVDYKEKEQYDLIKTSGLTSKYEGIPIIDNNRALEIGKEYLFCTSRTVEEFDFVINPTQFAHDINSQTAKTIMDLCK